MKRYRWKSDAFIQPPVIGIMLGFAYYGYRTSFPLWWLTLLIAVTMLAVFAYSAATGKLRVERVEYRIAQWRREDEAMSAKKEPEA